MASWSTHKPDCHEKKKSSKAASKEKKKVSSARNDDKANAKLKRNEAKEMVGDLKRVHATKEW